MNFPRISLEFLRGRRVDSLPVRTGYTSGQILDQAIWRLEKVLRELRPITDRQVTMQPGELYQRAAKAIDETHQGIADLKRIPRAREKK